MALTPATIFISYAWEDDDYKRWVELLAERLNADGVEVRLDRWHLLEGDNIAEFMNREIRQADFVVVLCSPAYRIKVHATEDGERLAGVGWESRLITSRRFAGQEKNKLIPVLTRGRWQDAAPDFLLGQFYVDLSDDVKAGYRQLLERLTGTRKKAPARGSSAGDLPSVPPALLAGPNSWDTASSAKAPEPTPPPAASRDWDLEFELRPESPGWTVALRSASEVVTASFEFDPGASDSQTARDLQALRDNTCRTDDIQNLGAELWTRLLGTAVDNGGVDNAVERAVRDARQHCRAQPDAILKLRLVLPPALEDLPWEAMWDSDELSLATSSKASLVRWPADVPAPAAPAASGRLTRLLVVIPAASQLQTSSEWERIRQSVAAVGEAIQLVTLDGQVTLNRLAQTLREGWDVVHFIGHGRLDERGQVQLRLNPEPGSDPEADPGWVPAHLFAQQFQRSGSRLVVLNCCHGGGVGPQALHGLGHYLTKVRVPAVVLMRHALRDAVAADFAAAFYRELLTGAQPGRVDLAVQEGRAALERTYRDADRARSYITPVLYLAPGYEQLFALPRLAMVETAASGDDALIECIDRRLRAAIASRSCLPIFGPGILNAGAERDHGLLVPGPGGLVQRLIQLPDFRDFDRLMEVADSVAGWLTPFIFERFCQHFESTHAGERRALNQMIQEIYRTCQPPPSLAQIATWRTPGMVYTYIDGLLEQCLRRVRGRDLRVVHAQDVLTAEGLSRDEMVLVNLRGTWTATELAAPAMILTEADEDWMLDRMPAVADLVLDLMNRVDGCTLLFLGVSPRDPLLRALARRLLKPELMQKRGTAFLVGTALAAADRSYWHQFPKLENLELDAESLIRGLSAVARRGEQQP